MMAARKSKFVPPPWMGECGFCVRSITEERASQIEDALEFMLKAVEISGDFNISQALLREAIYRKFILPNTSPAYQKAFLKANKRRTK